MRPELLGFSGRSGVLALVPLDLPSFPQWRNYAFRAARPRDFYPVRGVDG